MFQTATFIATNDFNSILDLLKLNKWKIKAEYLNFDKGIDFDFYTLRKNNEEILLTWDNCEEGSIKAEENVLNWLQKELGLQFRYGKVKYLDEDLRKIKKSLFIYFWR